MMQAHLCVLPLGAMPHGKLFRSGLRQMARGPVLYASDDSQDALDDAKAYIRRFSLDRDDVSLVVRNGQTLVIAKRDCSEKLVPYQ